MLRLSGADILSKKLLLFCILVLLTQVGLNEAANEMGKKGAMAQMPDAGDGDDESIKVSIIMQTMLPSMFNLFSNITNSDFKSQFKPPCRFDTMMDIFQQLPPYFDLMAKQFPNKPDLVAYYSMQMASTFLVNNGSLTMECLYNMLSLQTRLHGFSLDIMDNPESNPKLVGLFGVFMKPVMSKLKKNAMMKIIEHVDRYDKNDDRETIYLFNVLNFIYVTFGLVAILSNVLLIILLKRISNARKHRRTKVQPSEKSGDKTKTKLHELLPLNPTEANVIAKQTPVTYKSIKSRSSQTYYFIRKRYKTRICLILIAICHSLYIFINFMVMSQASLAAVALSGLSRFNFLCKFSFFLFPPTTAFNILHQFAIWLLCYAIRQHGAKLRKTRTFNADANADYDVNLMNSDDSEAELYSGDEETTESSSLANNNQRQTHIYNNFPILNHQRHPILPFPALPSVLTPQPPPPPPPPPPQPQAPALYQRKLGSSSSLAQSCLCYFFSRKRKNALFCLVLGIVLLAYNAHNIFLYSLFRLATQEASVNFCAFNTNFSEYYSILTQLVLPLSNLCLFSLLPLFLCTLQVLFDVCFLVRVQREQMKRYEKLKEVIEWPLYGYYVVYMVSQLPFALHNIVDLALGTAKFPFVFPLFIQLKFTSKVWLIVLEMTLIFVSYSSDLYIWLLMDKQFRRVASGWLNKRILCRTYNKKARGKCRLSEGTTSGSSTSSRSSTGFSDNVVVVGNKGQNSCASSTVSSSSDASSLGPKKLSPIVAAAADTAAATAKAAAAISASIGQPTIHEQLKQNQEPVRLKMIDTDNDEDDIELDAHHARIDAASLPRAQFDQPPSFNTAVMGKRANATRRPLQIGHDQSQPLKIDSQKSDF